MFHNLVSYFVLLLIFTAVPSFWCRVACWAILQVCRILWFIVRTFDRNILDKQLAWNIPNWNIGQSEEELTCFVTYPSANSDPTQFCNFFLSHHFSNDSWHFSRRKTHLLQWLSRIWQASLFSIPSAANKRNCHSVITFVLQTLNICLSKNKLLSR